MTEKRTWVGPSAPERLNILRNTRTIAIVGMSDKISRASYFVATYLQSASPYKLYFVNPILAAIRSRREGDRCSPAHDPPGWATRRPLSRVDFPLARSRRRTLNTAPNTARAGSFGAPPPAWCTFFYPPRFYF